MGNGGQMLVASDWWLVNPSPQPNQGRLMKSHKELNVWKDATDLAENIYQLTSVRKNYRINSIGYHHC